MSNKLFAVCMMASLMAFAQDKGVETLFEDSAEKGAGVWVNLTTTSTDTFEGSSSFLTTGNPVRNKRVFTLDPEATYRLSCAVRTTGEAKGAFYLGFTCLDAKGRAIPSQSVFYVDGTETQLAQDAYVGDMELILKDGSRWKAMSNGMVAYGIDETGAKRDLPNRNLSPMGIRKVEKVENGWKVTLSRTLNSDIKAGTWVREHKSWAVRNFVSSRMSLPTKWTLMRGSCKGIAEKGNARPGQWWPGTASFELVVFYNSADRKPLLVDQVKLEKLPGK